MKLSSFISTVSYAKGMKLTALSNSVISCFQSISYFNNNMAHTVDFIYFILIAPTSIALHRGAPYLICAFWVQTSFKTAQQTTRVHKFKGIENGPILCLVNYIFVFFCSRKMIY